MKIVILGPAPPFRGGISLFAFHLAEAFREQGHEVLFFTFQSQYPAWLFPGKNQFDSSLTATGFPTFRILTPWLPQSWEKTARKLKQEHPDILIVSWFLPFFAPAYAYVLHRVKPIRRIILAHNVAAHEKWAFTQTLTRLVFGQADRIVVLSKDTLQELNRTYPLNIARKGIAGFHPLYKPLASQPRTSDRPTLLFFGLIKPYKGLDVLLAAMPEIIKAIPEVRLIIAGEVYGDSAVYLNQIRHLGIANHVETHLRYIASSEIAALFSETDLCVLPYKSASQSGVIATSYSYLVPVLATETGGLGEYVFEGKTGYLVPPNSPTELAKAAIRHLQEKPEMKQAIADFTAKLSWHKLAELVIT